MADHPYYRTILLIERLHRYFLEVVKAELDRNGVQDINNVQALILYNIGDDELTVGELTARGYYLGSNVSYNVKKMVENGYLEQQRSPHDRRSVRVRASKRGREMGQLLSRAFATQIEALGQSRIGGDALDDVNVTLSELERFWNLCLAGPGRMFSAA
ncbi:MAG: winged helix DNA-binding protein [Alphaproteobacteria bacterium]|jgi:DNA-binding MarR family transcriptional regulator|nr:winged helix DNA-binding protein [Alphaproteobacteria bacterium]